MCESLFWCETGCVFVCGFASFELIVNLHVLCLQIVVNTVTYCFYVWLVTEILRWVIGWAFFREQSRNVVYNVIMLRKWD